MIFCISISSTKTLKQLQYKFEEGEVHVYVMNLFSLLTERWLHWQWLRQYNTNFKFYTKRSDSQLGHEWNIPCLVSIC